MARIEDDGTTLRFEHVASFATRCGGCGCLFLALTVVAFLPIFWLSGHETRLHCDRGVGTCTFELRQEETFPIAALKGVKAFRYAYGGRSSTGHRRAVHLTVEGRPKADLMLCDAPDGDDVARAHRQVQLAILSFVGDPHAAPVVDVRCDVERYNLQDRLLYSFVGLLFGVIAVFVAAVPRRVEVSFDRPSRTLRYLVRRMGFPRGMREVPFEDVSAVELTIGRGGRTRALGLFMKNGERWGLASSAVETPVDAELEGAKARIEEVLRPG